MSWITLTEADAQTALAGAELSAYRTKALSDGQADPLPEQLARVTKTVRGYVAACDANRLGPAGTIPEELESATVALLAWELASRLPLPGGLTDRLRTRKEDAERLLRDVAACKFAIEQPPFGGASTEEIPGAGTPHVTGKTLHFTRAHQDGL